MCLKLFNSASVWTAEWFSRELEKHAQMSSGVHNSFGVSANWAEVIKEMDQHPCLLVLAATSDSALWLSLVSAVAGPYRRKTLILMGQPAKEKSSKSCLFRWLVIVMVGFHSRITWFPLFWYKHRSIYGVGKSYPTLGCDYDFTLKFAWYSTGKIKTTPKNTFRVFGLP